MPQCYIRALNSDPHIAGKTNKKNTHQKMGKTQEHTLGKRCLTALKQKEQLNWMESHFTLATRRSLIVLLLGVGHIRGLSHHNILK